MKLDRYKNRYATNNKEIDLNEIFNNIRNRMRVYKLTIT